MKLARLVSSTALALGILSGQAANATTVEFTGYAVGPTVVQLNAPWNGYVNAGEFAINVDGVPMTSFCIDLMQSLSFNTPHTDYSLTALNGSVSNVQLTRFGQLYENYYGTARTNATASAAFQTAVWEIINDGSGSLNLGAGSFRLGSGTPATVASLASTWLTDLDSKSAGSWSFTRLGSGTWQDQLLASQVPVPGTLGLVALAGFGLVVGSRRRKGSD
ncbi:MAG: PEP-CTERM sorting domain-containing protein [Burkholderiaceae bacterium]|nr:PEP-CTERM sorting domain-containing protein [Burkholderiaceae bacterium]